MAITINVNGVNSGGGNNNQNPSSNNPDPAQQIIPYKTPDFSPYASSAGSQGTNNPMPTSDRMINDIRAEISRRGVILVPGTQNFSVMLNTMRQNMRTNVMGQIDNQYERKMWDIDNRKDALMYEIKGRLDLSRDSELATTNDPTRIAEINKRYDRLMDREVGRVDRYFSGQYDAVEQEHANQTAEVEQLLIEAIQRLTEELSQGNKDSYLNNLRDRYKEQIWRRDNADTEEEVREASREAAKIQERMQRAMSPTNLTMQRWLGTIGTIATTAINTGVQLDRIGIQQDYVGFDMASSVLNGNAFAAIRQENALKEQRNSALYGGIGTAGGALIGAAIGSAFGGVGAIPGYAIGGLIGMLMGTGIGTLGGHLANRGMLIEDERTRVAELWKQEEQRMMAFNDLIMLTRGTYQNPNDIEGIRQRLVNSSGERAFVKAEPSSGGGIIDAAGDAISSITSYIKNMVTPTTNALSQAWQPSETVKRDIATREGAAMYTRTYDPNLQRMVNKNASFEEVAKEFVKVLPNSIRGKVLSNRELADNLYSYAYNVGPDRFRQRVVSSLERYYNGEGTAEEVASSMWASGDRKPGLGGLRKRRAKERAGVIHALTGKIDEDSAVLSDFSSDSYYDDVSDEEAGTWRRSVDNLDIYDLGYTASEFAQQAARRIKQRGFVGSDAVENAFYSDALERIFSLNSGTLGQLSQYDRFGNNANQDFTNLAYTLNQLGTTGMRQGAWARSDEFAGYMTQLQQGQRSVFLTVDNDRVGRQIATGQAIFGDKFGSEVLQGIQQVNNTIQNPKGGFAQTLLYDVVQELYPDTRGRIDKIEQALYDPRKQNEIQQEYQKRIQSIYGGVDTTAGYLAAQDIWGIQNPNIMMPIVKQLSRNGGLEGVKLDKSHDAKTEAQILNNSYTPQTTQRLSAAADQQMKSLLGYQETIAEVVQNILDKIETVVADKLQEAVDNLK